MFTTTTLKKVLLIAGVLFLLAAMLVVITYKWLTNVHAFGSAARIARQIDTFVTSYIRANDGQFPGSLVDLQRQLIIRKIDTTEGPHYFMRSAFFDPEQPHNKHAWIRIWDFELFDIRYGTEPNRIEEVGGNLYDKSTNNQILLIDGPYHEHLAPTHYQPISLKWYKLMLEECEKNKTSQEPVIDKQTPSLPISGAGIPDDAL